MARPKEDMAKRFLKKIDPRPSGCWHWKDYTSETRRPHLWDGTKTIRAAHAALIVMRNEHVPKGMAVCHKCDNPMCVNPDHLFIGTQRENMRDCVAKGRNGGKSGPGPGPGMKNPKAKLTDADVLAIRASTEPDRVLADRYGVTRPNIYSIRRRRIWTHLP